MPFRLLSLTLAAASLVGCKPAARSTVEAALVLAPSTQAVGGHLPPKHAVAVRTLSGVQQVSEGAYFAALGPEDRVAFVDDDGLKLWRDGSVSLVAAAAPRGLGAGPIGVAFASKAESGEGTGVSLLAWSGEVRALIAAPDGLPAAAGYHSPSASPDGRFVIAFNDLTPRPSIVRVSVETGEVRELSADAPSLVGAPSWEGDALVWSTGDGHAALDVRSGELSLR